MLRSLEVYAWLVAGLAEVVDDRFKVF